MQAQAASNITPERLRAADPWYWAYYGQISLQGGEFAFKGHEYLKAPLSCYHPHQVTKKGAQMGFTEKEVLKTLHGQIYGRYPIGVLHLFPTSDDVTDFTKARFNTLITANPQIIGRFVSDTDAATIKKINGSMLYLRGAKATRNIEGIRKTSSKLKSIPVDRIVYDERDEMDQDMVDLALERISHSSIQEVSKLSTPTVPDYGIDKDYKNSDARVWMIRCNKCGKENVLELEFPNCLLRTRDNRVHRVCVRCQNEIHPWDGQWIAQYPSKTDCVGWWISQLNSMYVSPAEILRIYERLGDPDVMSKQEFYNSKLAEAYVDAENRLTKEDLYRCIGQDAMSMSHPGPCAMGVDVGTWLHVVIGIRPNEYTKKILYAGRVKDWNELGELGKRFGLHHGGCCVIDGEPERSKVREFQAAAPFSVYLSDYQENQRGAPRWDHDKREVIANRTEMLDRTHSLVTGNFIGRPKIFEIPRRSSEVDQYIAEMTNLVKVLIEDERGNNKYIYKQLGADHYRHATVYFDLACERIPIYVEQDRFWSRPAPASYSDYDPLHRQSTGFGERDNYADYDPFGR